MVKRINVLLSETLYSELASQCAAINYPMAEVIRTLIARELKRPTIKARALPASDGKEDRRQAKKERHDAVIKAALAKVPYREIAEKHKISISSISKLLSRRGISVNL